ncbi:hypothetical protein AB0L66_11395 [Streptomyces sp. NPDC052207]|uniref:hypothetical protein n=1 Tax=Streptomyces sp. NPDC052207 TaxID=3155418 RepID=UPI00341C9AFE
MDAGVAAVLGAAIGGGLATLTAVGTSFLALRVTRLQLKAQESEASRQRRFESLRERREPRAKAYANFLNGAERFVELIVQGQPAEALMAQVDEMSKLQSTVQVWGPPTVAAAAAWVVKGAVRATRRIHHEGNVSRAPLVAEVGPLIIRFIEAARAAIEEEITEQQ